MSKLHILGICGTFMGGVAALARELGHAVDGSDHNVYPPMSTQLERLGIALRQGYSPDNISADCDEIIVGNGGAPLTSYQVTVSPGGGTVTVPGAASSGTAGIELARTLIVNPLVMAQHANVACELRELDRQRHLLRRLVAGVAEHHALVARALRVDVAVGAVVLKLVRGVHAAPDVERGERVGPFLEECLELGQRGTAACRDDELGRLQQQVLKLEPDSPQTFYSLGSAYAAQRDEPRLHLVVREHPELGEVGADPGSLRIGVLPGVPTTDHEAPASEVP